MSEINYKKLEDAIAKGIARGLSDHERQVARHALQKKEFDKQREEALASAVRVGDINTHRQKIAEQAACEHVWYRGALNDVCTRCGINKNRFTGEVI